MNISPGRPFYTLVSYFSDRKAHFPTHIIIANTAASPNVTHAIDSTGQNVLPIQTPEVYISHSYEIQLKRLVRNKSLLSTTSLQKTDNRKCWALPSYKITTQNAKCKTGERKLTYSKKFCIPHRVYRHPDQILFNVRRSPWSQNHSKAPCRTSRRKHTTYIRLHTAGPKTRELRKVEIEKLLPKKIIELPQTECAAPIALAPNKDGTPLFCVEYCKRNAVKRDSYLEPRMDEWINSLGETATFSTLHANSRY